MPVTTRSQTAQMEEAASVLMTLRSSPRFAAPKRSVRPERKAAKIARVLIRMSAEALNQED